MSNTFTRKAYGRIFVEKEEDVQKVKDIIRKMDEFEYGYLTEDLITVFSPNIRRFPDHDPKDHLWLDMAYTHKFDSLNLNELQFRCWAAGIKVFCCMNHNGYSDDSKWECYDVWEDF